LLIERRGGFLIHSTKSFMRGDSGWGFELGKGFAVPYEPRSAAKLELSVPPRHCRCKDRQKHEQPQLQVQISPDGPNLGLILR